MPGQFFEQDDHVEEARVPSDGRPESVRATHVVNCKSLVHCAVAWPQVRDLHQRIPNYLGYAKAMPIVPPPLWRGTHSTFPGPGGVSALTVSTAWGDYVTHMRTGAGPKASCKQPPLG